MHQVSFLAVWNHAKWLKLNFCIFSSNLHSSGISELRYTSSILPICKLATVYTVRKSVQIVTSGERSKFLHRNMSVHPLVYSNDPKNLQSIHTTYIIVLWCYICFHNVPMLCYAHFKDVWAGLVTNCYTDSCHTQSMLIDFLSIALVLERNMALGLNRINIMNPLKFFIAFGSVSSRTKLFYKRNPWPSFPVTLCALCLIHYTLFNLQVHSKYSLYYIPENPEKNGYNRKKKKKGLNH